MHSGPPSLLDQADAAQLRTPRFPAILVQDISLQTISATLSLSNQHRNPALECRLGNELKRIPVKQASSGFVRAQPKRGSAVSISIRRVRRFTLIAIQVSGCKFGL